MVTACQPLGLPAAGFTNGIRHYGALRRRDERKAQYARPVELVPTGWIMRASTVPLISEGIRRVATWTNCVGFSLAHAVSHAWPPSLVERSEDRFFEDSGCLVDGPARPSSVAGTEPARICPFFTASLNHTSPRLCSLSVAVVGQLDDHADRLRPVSPAKADTLRYVAVCPVEQRIRRTHRARSPRVGSAQSTTCAST
jgi:hypothetical protein